MKKSLIALAALAAVSVASAQSTVTISGVLDFAAATNTKITTQANTNPATDVKTSTTGQQNTWTPGQISFSGTEDLGGGLKASFVVNSDITGGLGFATRDTSVALAGGFGNVRIGRFITASALGFHALSGAATSNVGSLYGMGGTSVAARERFGNFSAGSFDRGNNTVQYTSPAFNGLTLNVNHRTNKSDASNLAGETDATQTGYGLNYAQGPLVVAVGINTRNVDTQAVIATPTVRGINIESDLNWIAASYNLGVARLFATNVSRKDETTTALGVTTINADVQITNVGVSVPMGAFTFAASTNFGKDKVTPSATDNLKLSGNQFSVRYALSKRTYAYGLMGTNKIERDSGNTGGTALKSTVSSFGLVHSF